MKIHILESEHWPNKTLQQEILNTITQAHESARKIIPNSSDAINYIVQPSKYDFIKETGVLGYSYNSELIKISFDYTLPYGKDVLLDNVHSSVFHEYNHVARWHVTKYDDSLLNYAVSEGLATVFERDYSNAKSKPLWGIYEDDTTMDAWLQEVLALKNDWSKKDDFAFDHPDGRRWILYKLGTWLVDKKLRESTESIAGLTAKPATYFLPQN